MAPPLPDRPRDALRDPRTADVGRSGDARPSAGTQPGSEPHLLTRLNERGFRLVQLADALVLLAVMFGTALVRWGLAWPTYPKPLYVMSFVVTTGIFLATFYFGGLYEREPRLGYPPALPRVVRLTLAATGLWAAIQIAATSIAQQLGYDVARALPMPITNLVVLFVAGSILVAGNRRLANWLRLQREGPPRVLLVGAPDDVDVAQAHLRGDEQRARVVGAVSSTDRLVQRVREQGATEVVLLSAQWLDSLYPEALGELERLDVNVLQRVTARETMFGLERIRQVGGMPFVLLRLHTVPISRMRFKRFTDVVLLGLLSPLVLGCLGLLALYQLVVVGRPILFWQDRVGAQGRHFRMVKFRTMHQHAEEDGNPRLATRDDPRIVPACRWLRATRLDELPQVWNVARGEMSLVGPRPERPELTAQYEEIIPGYARRHELPPGMTGLAQIHGRYHTDPEYKLGYDLQYLVNWSLTLDLEILARTVWVVVTRRI